MIVNLHGFLEGDFVGRVIFVDTEQDVGSLAIQLQAWGPGLYPSFIPAPMVTNEGGVILDPASTLTDAGLDAGDIFHVRSGRA